MKKPLYIFLASTILTCSLVVGLHAEKQIVHLFSVVKHEIKQILTPKTYAKSLVLKAGLSLREWGCFSEVIYRESRWNYLAVNHRSGAYGLAQAMPADKMEVTGRDYLTNPQTQIKWALRYMKSRYGTPCGALRFHNTFNWY
jgi:hypothetical protein